jgi:hypothetical protein
VGSWLNSFSEKRGKQDVTTKYNLLSIFQKVFSKYSFGYLATHCAWLLRAPLCVPEVVDDDHELHDWLHFTTVR